MGKPQFFSDLQREEKRAVGLLSIGTFLEYFDLMLYVHMAVMLNELFFPPSDPHTASLYTAAAFCSTFVFRPVGALIFGWIGDNIGRKATVIITTMLMATCCCVIATLEPYDDIKIRAAITLTICRAVQGMSSMGEIIGAKIYLTEMTKPPVQYPMVSMVGTLSTLGTFTALGVATIVTSTDLLDWRMAFWFGAIIAVVGVAARTTLRETPEFADAKRYLTKIAANVSEKINDKVDILKSPIINEKINKKTALSYFLMECMWPVSFYFTYLHCSNILKNSFGYSSAQVIQHNLTISIIHFVSCVALTYLSYRIYPLRIIRFRLKIFWALIIVIPLCLYYATNPFHILLIQAIYMIFRPDTSPATPIYIKHFPIFKRFSATSWIFALSRVTMHLVTSFGLIYLVKYFGNLAPIMLIIMFGFAFVYGLKHFEKLEQEAGNYPNPIASNTA